MADLNIDSLVAPLASDGPCGANLEYEPAFEAMQQASTIRPETQYGDKITPAQPADWPVVRQHALMLAERTRDLRVVVFLIRAEARVGTFETVAQGLQILRTLIETQWDNVYPLLDASDNNDPTARVNTLATLTHENGLADFRAAPIVPGRGAVTVRDLELVFGRVDPKPGESAPTEEGITPAVIAAQAQVPGLAAAMAGAVESVKAMGKVLDDRLGSGMSPDLSPVIKLLQAVADAGRVAQGQPTEAQVADGAGAGAHAASAKPAGSIESRDDAIRALQRVCDWLERNEPSHPAPLLISRAQRLLKKNFMEIIKDLAPDGLGQIEKLAGPAE